MEALIAEAAQALAAGNPLGALNRVALRRDAPALALRGIAMAQLGDFARAKRLLRHAARAFGPRAAIARARCVVAEAEIALASRDLTWPVQALETARATLEAHGDRANAAHARQLQLRRLLVIGRIGEAERLLAAFAPGSLPPALRATHELAVAGIALRRFQTQTARRALGRADRAARQAGIPALEAEVKTLREVLSAPAARLLARGKERLLRLDEVEALRARPVLVVDAFRRCVRQGRMSLLLRRRPVLFALARALGEAWPGDAPRTALILRAFQARTINESHRARLRVEIARLRKLLSPWAAVVATMRGFQLQPRRAREVAVLAWPAEEEQGAVLALLADGEAWSSSALALALGASQRTVQRTLDALAAAGRIRFTGRARARRWLTAPVPGFATILLLPAPLG
ncbi:MAG TPA: hypothetical protein VFE31_08445 [Opitutaceae bacterium]|jgi:hypothetical protein|nr:hypothetical protein [Opitutaceae bacterium]